MQAALASLTADAWRLLGPPNHQHYHSLSSLLPSFLTANGCESDFSPSKGKASSESATTISSCGSSSALPEPLRELLLVFRSDAMFLTLSGLTGLELHPMSSGAADESDGAESANGEEDEDEEPDDDDQPDASTADASCAHEELDDSDAADEHYVSSGEDDSEEEEADGVAEGEKSAETEAPNCKKARLDSADAPAPQTAAPTADSSAADKCNSARCSVEVRRWAPGDYSLASDDAFAHRTANALDALLYVVDGGEHS